MNFVQDNPNTNSCAVLKNPNFRTPTQAVQALDQLEGEVLHMLSAEDDGLLHHLDDRVAFLAKILAEISFEKT